MLGFRYVKGVGEAAASAIVEARDRAGPFASLADIMERTGLQREALENLVNAGAFDSLQAGPSTPLRSAQDERVSSPTAHPECSEMEPQAEWNAVEGPDRRATLWEVGLRYRPVGYQMALPFPVEQDMAQLPAQSPWDVMLEEYRTLGLHPSGHFMAMLRPYLGEEVLSSQDIVDLEDGMEVTVSGLVIRRQRPLAKAVFITLEDEFGHVPLVVWPKVYQRYRLAIREPVLVVRGEISRREGTMNIAVHYVVGAHEMRNMPKAKRWQ